MYAGKYVTWNRQVYIKWNKINPNIWRVSSLMWLTLLIKWAQLYIIELVLHLEGNLLWTRAKWLAFALPSFCLSTDAPVEQLHYSFNNFLIVCIFCNYSKSNWVKHYQSLRCNKLSKSSIFGLMFILRCAVMVPLANRQFTINPDFEKQLERPKDLLQIIILDLPLYVESHQNWMGSSLAHFSASHQVPWTSIQ